jgi:predicted neutral ceramidase superfamily lipid hydrolase
MKNFGIEIKWGFIFSISLLLWMMLEKALGLHDELIEKHAIYTNFFSIVAIAVYVVALLDKRKNYYSGKMTWLQGFISGVAIAVVVAILSPLTQYITSTVITPEYFPNVIKASVELGKMTLEEAEKYFTLQNYIIQSTLGALIMGVITSAIVALFTRKK